MRARQRTRIAGRIAAVAKQNEKSFRLLAVLDSVGKQEGKTYEMDSWFEKPIIVYCKAVNGISNPSGML